MLWNGLSTSVSGTFQIHRAWLWPAFWSLASLRTATLPWHHLNREPSDQELSTVVDDRNLLQNITKVAAGLKHCAAFSWSPWSNVPHSFGERPWDATACSTPLLWHLVTMSEGWMSLFNTTSDSNLASLSLISLEWCSSEPSWHGFLVKPPEQNLLLLDVGGYFPLPTQSNQRVQGYDTNLCLSPNSCFTTAKYLFPWSCSILFLSSSTQFPRSITEYHGPGEACCTPWCGHGKCRPTTLPSLLSLEPKPRHRSHRGSWKLLFWWVSYCGWKKSCRSW